MQMKNTREAHLNTRDETDSEGCICTYKQPSSSRCKARFWVADVPPRCRFRFQAHAREGDVAGVCGGPPLVSTTAIKGCERTASARRRSFVESDTVREVKKLGDFGSLLMNRRLPEQRHSSKY